MNFRIRQVSAVAIVVTNDNAALPGGVQLISAALLFSCDITTAWSDIRPVCYMITNTRIFHVSYFLTRTGQISSPLTRSQATVSI